MRIPAAMYSIPPLTSTILLTQVGKAPDVAQPHRVADNAEKELHFATPGSPVRFSWYIHRLHRVALRCRQHNGHSMGAIATGSCIEWRHLVTVARCINDFGGGHQSAESISLFLQRAVFCNERAKHEIAARLAYNVH